VHYDDAAALEATLLKLRSLPPLVTSWEVERLKRLLADAEAGKRFILQGGDCAETLADCRPDLISSKLKILLQMSLVLVRAARRPVVRIGRMAGQYAKPRSAPLEVSGDVRLPSYFGDLINGAEYTKAARTPDPKLLLEGYSHAAMTLNFVRSLAAAGFADMQHPEQWDLPSLGPSSLTDELREEYAKATTAMQEAVQFMEVLGERTLSELSRVEFYVSHEGLHLEYEAAQTRQVPRRLGHYCLTTHMPWIGERTRALDGAHVEFFRGIENPIGIKLGPNLGTDDLLALVERLNPRNDGGKLVLITRVGVQHVERIRPWIAGLQRAGLRATWICDPMHGNTTQTAAGRKTRRVSDIVSELDATFEVHRSEGSALGGVHLELTGEDVTECVGSGVREQDLEINYSTACDPRLNYRQAMEVAFHAAKSLKHLAVAPRPAGAEHL
jgi:3-deoxy-7-phosphoheptulonate synthase